MRRSLLYLQEPAICSYPNQFRRVYPVYLRSILTLPSHLRSGLQIALLPTSFPTKTPLTCTIMPCVPHTPPISSSLYLSLYLMCESQNFPWGSLLQSDINFILGPISSSVPRYLPLKLYFPSVWPTQVLCPHHATGNVVGFFFYFYLLDFGGESFGSGPLRYCE
jgi:hypothetical protein